MIKHLGVKFRGCKSNQLMTNHGTASPLLGRVQRRDGPRFPGLTAAFLVCPQPLRVPRSVPRSAGQRSGCGHSSSGCGLAGTESPADTDLLWFQKLSVATGTASPVPWGWAQLAHPQLAHTAESQEGDVSARQEPERFYLGTLWTCHIFLPGLACPCLMYNPCCVSQARFPLIV